MFPELMSYFIVEKDKIHKRNVDRLRVVMQEMIDHRRSGRSSSSDDSDLLSIMLNSSLFANGQDDVIKDEMFSFFLAGMKTIQLTTVNLCYYVTKHKEVRDKLLAEVIPPLENCADNILDGFDYETAMDFEYLSQVFYETMRIEPPVAMANGQYSTEDIVIGQGKDQFMLKKGQPFFIMMYEMHHDLEVWKEPKKFEPERFNKASEWYKTPDGKNRSSLVFNPFLGGKRICLGKSFADVAFRYTIPLIFYHMNMEFVKPEQADFKQKYMIGGSEELVLPLKLSIRKEVVLNK
jgi:cytochrome P450